MDIDQNTGAIDNYYVEDLVFNNKKSSEELSSEDSRKSQPDTSSDEVKSVKDSADISDEARDLANQDQSE